ncbi:hypothetical protein ACEPAG_4679 [Sanghuangporus baumii]
MLYLTSNQQELVFRIGQRIFYSDPEQDDINEQGCLGVLPLVYDQGNLRLREVSFALTMRMSLADCSD